MAATVTPRRPGYHFTVAGRLDQRPARRHLARGARRAAATSSSTSSTPTPRSGRRPAAGGRRPRRTWSAGGIRARRSSRGRRRPAAGRARSWSTRRAGDRLHQRPGRRPGHGPDRAGRGRRRLAALDPRPRRAGDRRARAGPGVRPRARPVRLAGRRRVADGRRRRQHRRAARRCCSTPRPTCARWRPDGVLVEPEPGRPGPGGTVWECPQLFPLDGAWVLIVSVWDEGPGGVACAVGDYDGRRFTARSWQRLAADPAATPRRPSPTRRAGGAPSPGCRRPAPCDGAWAGALSVPWLLGLRRGPRHGRAASRRRLAAHRRPADSGRSPRAEPMVLARRRPGADVDLRADPAGGVRWSSPSTTTGGRLLSVVLDPVAGEVRLPVPGRPDVARPLRPERGRRGRPSAAGRRGRRRGLPRRRRRRGRAAAPSGGELALRPHRGRRRRPAGATGRARHGAGRSG